MSLPTTAPAVASLEDVVAAARAAAGLVPAPGQLVVDPAADGSPTAVPDAGAPAVTAPYSGARSGHVVLVLDTETASALLSDPAGPGGAPEAALAAAVRPALEAAAGAAGPVVLGPVEVGAVGDLDLSSVPVVPLLVDGTARAWVALVAGDGHDAAPTPSPSAGGALGGVAGLALLRDVEMTLSVEIGRARMTVRELLTLTPGSVVELDRAAGAPADLLVNGRLVARGEVVVVDEDFGLRVTEIVDDSAAG